MLDAEAWREAPAAVARRALDRLLREMGCGPAGRALFDSLRDPEFRGGSVDREVKVVVDGRGRLVFERAAD